MDSLEFGTVVRSNIVILKNMAASRSKSELWKTLKPDVEFGNFAALLWLADEYPAGRKTSGVPVKYPQAYANLRYITSFLPENVTTARRLWHVRNNTSQVPSCKVCNNSVKWFNAYNDYAETCSVACAAKLRECEVVKKRLSVQEKYGAEHYFQSDDFKLKSRKTLLEKYGTDTYVKSSDFKYKTKKTFLEKYGTDHYLKNDDKKREILERRVENSGYASPFSDPKIRESINATFKTRYGAHPTQARFTKDTLDKLQDPEWLRKMHHDNGFTLSEISEMLESYDISSISDHMAKFGIEVRSRVGSRAQRELASYLRGLGIDFRENDRQLIAPLELDFVIDDKKLAIEYCGLFWHSEDSGKPITYHLNKFLAAKEKGYRLITIFEDEWLEKRSIVEKKIRYLVGLNEDKVFARKCNIVRLTKDKRKTFLDANHIQGDGGASHAFGLTIDNDIVACMAFSRHNNEILLNRYATSINVVGGFSKLLKYARDYFKEDIVTFADLRWSCGDLYERTGFEVDRYVSPDYSVVKGNRRYHKFNFRKSLIKQRYGIDPKTEREFLRENGFKRIWDCGKIKYRLKW